MDAPGEPGERRADAGSSRERRGAGPAKARGEGNAPAGNPSRPPQDARRKRGNEQRYLGFGDGLDRFVCARALHVLPTTFPVESHSGAATIAPIIVARRPDALLLCTFSHCGEHVWPDGEVVADASDKPATPITNETAWEQGDQAP